MSALIKRQRLLSVDHEVKWLPTPLKNQKEPMVTDEKEIIYKVAKARMPVQALIVYFRR